MVLITDEMQADKPLSVFRPLQSILGRHRAKFRAAFALHVVHGVTNVVPLVVVSILASQLVSGSLSSRAVLVESIVIAIAIAVSIVASGAGNRILFSGAYEVGRDLRYEMVKKVRSAAVGDVLNIPPGEVTATIDRDVADLEAFLDGPMPRLTSSAVAPVLLTIVVAVVDPIVGGALLVAVIGVAAGYRLKLRAQGRHSGLRRQLRAFQDERVVEFVQGIEVAKAFGLRSEMAAQLDQSLRNYRDENLKSVRHTIPISSALVASASLISGGLLAIGGWRFEQGALDASMTAMLLVLIAGASRGLIALGSATGAIPHVAASLKRIKAILDLPPAPIGSGGGRPESFDVTFADVGFSYSEGSPVLRGVLFTAPEGSVTAITGRSGAGKTTVLHLLAGLWTPDVGTITIGGIELSKFSPDERTDLLSIVLQDPYFPAGTIRGAIAGGREVEDAAIESAARTARCWDLVQGLPNGFDTQVGEAGKRLSGGERQRISIARALISDTPIVLLDEATAALDATTERSLLEAMSALLRNRTVLVVAHRQVTIRASDHIVVIDDGVVAESGTHSSLMAAGGIYANRTVALDEASRRGFSR